MRKLQRLMGLSVSAVIVIAIVAAHAQETPAANRVYASFDLNHPDGGPFPADIFTIEDATQNTGLRINYPLPDCAVRPTDCDDLAEVNTLDGWGLQPRISVSFTGDIDPASLNSGSVFLVTMEGERIGINQLTWDPGTHTLFAESDAVLDQQRQYALIVTDAVRDRAGKAVKATSDFKEAVDLDAPDSSSAPFRYRERLVQAVNAADAAGIKRSAIVSASAFTTQTVTSVLEHIRDSIKDAKPAPADFNLGPNGERSVFPKTIVASATWLRQTTVNQPLSPVPINLAPLNVVPGKVGTIAYGRYQSPEYLVHPGEYIPAVGTADTPPVRATNTIYFTLYLPAGPKPPGGWPMAIQSGGASTNKHVSSTFFAAELATHGIAAIGINHVGQGFGPLTQLQIDRTDGTSLVIPDAGRSVDQNGDNLILATEGSKAAPPRAWTIAERDAHRQTLIDFLQLVRVIEVGMDVDGDGVKDIDSSRIYFVGASTGSMIGTLFLALEPSVKAGVCAFTPGVIPEHLRWQIVRRPEIGAALQTRVPSLLNAVDGLTAIDGVPVQAPYFNENKPLRDLPIVINNVPGALEIQHVLELSEMVSESGLSPALWSRYLREAPLPGSYPKSVVYMFALGDRTSVNPGTSLLLRAGDLADRTIYFRTDLAVAQDPAFPRDPHAFLINVLSADALTKAVALSGQDAIGAFLETDGATMKQPTLADLFEMPIAGPLPETLNYVR
jgi:hypothetical protein